MNGLKTDLLVGAADGTAWGARVLNAGAPRTDLVHFTLTLSPTSNPAFYCDSIFPNGIDYALVSGFTDIRGLDAAGDGRVFVSDFDPTGGARVRRS